MKNNFSEKLLLSITKKTSKQFDIIDKYIKKGYIFSLEEIDTIFSDRETGYYFIDEWGLKYTLQHKEQNITYKIKEFVFKYFLIDYNNDYNLELLKAVKEFNFWDDFKHFFKEMIFDSLSEMPQIHYCWFILENFDFFKGEYLKGFLIRSSSKYLIPQFSLLFIGYLNEQSEYETKLVSFFHQNINKEKKELKEYIINLSLYYSIAIRKKSIELIGKHFKDIIRYSYIEKYLKKEYERGNIDDYALMIKEYAALK